LSPTSSVLTTLPFSILNSMLESQAPERVFAPRMIPPALSTVISLLCIFFLSQPTSKMVLPPCVMVMRPTASIGSPSSGLLFRSRMPGLRVNRGSVSIVEPCYVPTSSLAFHSVTSCACTTSGRLPRTGPHPDWENLNRTALTWNLADQTSMPMMVSPLVHLESHLVSGSLPPGNAGPAYWEGAKGASLGAASQLSSASARVASEIRRAWLIKEKRMAYKMNRKILE